MDIEEKEARYTFQANYHLRKKTRHYVFISKVPSSLLEKGKNSQFMRRVMLFFGKLDYNYRVAEFKEYIDSGYVSLFFQVVFQKPISSRLFYEFIFELNPEVAKSRDQLGRGPYERLFFIR